MKHTIRTLIMLILIVAGFASIARPASAVEPVAQSTAQLTSFGTLMTDKRVTHLRAFLANYDSPLASEARTFVKEADAHNVDWRLMVAIAGTESTFGKHIPSNSYNAWGWGIPTGAQYGVGFKDWHEGIVTVTVGLRANYMDKGAQTLDQIGAIYAASPAWAGHVRFFLEKIDAFTPADPDFLDVTI